MNKYLVITEVDKELKNDVVEAGNPFQAMTKVSFLGNYNVKKQELATVGVYKLEQNLLDETIPE